MKSPTSFRFISRSIMLARPCYSHRMGPRMSKLTRDFSATSQRPFIDECLIGSHTLITAVHDSTGLSWAVTIPLFAFLVRVVLLTPLEAFSTRANEKRVKVARQFEGSISAIEKQVQEEHKDKNPTELRRIQNVALRNVLRDLVKQNGAQAWRTYALYVKCPIWLTMMETMRRMTGTEDGMPSLVAQSLTTLKGKQHSEPGTADDLIPLEPSLATEGILWFDNLMVPDPLLVLPFATSMVAIFTLGRTFTGLAVSSSSPKRVMRAAHLNVRWRRYTKLAALTLGPATLLFPSAMLLYCISTNLATLVVRRAVRFIKLNIQLSRAASTLKAFEEKKKPKPPPPPRMQEYRGPLRVPKKKK